MVSYKLDPTRRSKKASDLETALKQKIIGQDEPISKIVSIVQTILAGLHPPNRTLGTILLLGSTGTGKTQTVKYLAKELFGSEKALFCIDCQEYQQTQDISKVLGAPPGYTGHKDTEPLITQQKLDQYQTPEHNINIVLLDEIEKASDSFFKLLLGILGSGSLKTSQNRDVDFSRSIIFMTSNLGADQVKSLLTRSLGFSSPASEDLNINQKIKNTLERAVEKQFSPEFIGRLQNIITFNNLTIEDARQILRIELNLVRKRVLSSSNLCTFTFICDIDTEEFLLKEGYSKKYGARHMTDTITKYIVNPLSNLLASDQIEFGDTISLNLVNNEISFTRIPGEDALFLPEEVWQEYKMSWRESCQSMSTTK